MFPPDTDTALVEEINAANTKLKIHKKHLDLRNKYMGDISIDK